MAKYYAAIVVLLVLAIAMTSAAVCQHYRCENYWAKVNPFKSSDPLAKYQSLLNDPRFAKATVADIAEKIKPNGQCELFQRAMQSLSYGGEHETVERKVEAVLIYQEAESERCAKR